MPARAKASGKKRRARPAKGALAKKASKSAPARKSSPARPVGLHARLPPDLTPSSLISAAFGRLPAVTATSDTLIPAKKTGVDSESLAAESLVHLAEGWKYFSISLSAYMSGATRVSLHNSYYAELRAAISLLAAAGIRIAFPNHSFIDRVGSNVVPQWRAARTHTLVWELWQDWSKSTTASSLILDQWKIHPRISLRDVQSIFVALSPASTLKAWGFDLLELQDDHNARNEASYEATAARQPIDVRTEAHQEFVRNIWHLLQPSSAGLQFEKTLVQYFIDLHLADLNDHAVQSGAAFDAVTWHTGASQQLAVRTGVPQDVVHSLLVGKPYSTEPFRLAFERRTSPENVLSRAFTLLRAATSAVDASLTLQPSSNGTYFAGYAWPFL
jgi:hypothetical protein